MVHFDIIANYKSINSKNLKGGFLYSDCLVSDSHLVLSVLSTPVEHGLELANYVNVDYPKKKENFFELNWQDQISKKNGILKSKIVVSCTGVWSDKFIRSKKNLFGYHTNFL